MKTKSKVAIIIVLIVLFIGIGVWIFPNILIYVMKNTKYSYELNPKLYSVASYRDIPFNEIKSTENVIIYESIEILCPWGEPIETKESSSLIAFIFDNDNKILLHAKNDVNFVNMFKMGVLENDIDIERESREKLDKIFNEETLSSDFIFQKTILNTTPDQIKLFMPKREIIKTYVYLTIKDLAFSFIEPKNNYYFENTYTKGFQLRTNNGLVIWAYDKYDYQYQIVIYGDNLNQQEIDDMISSIRFIYE